MHMRSELKCNAQQHGARRGGSSLLRRGRGLVVTRKTWYTLGLAVSLASLMPSTVSSQARGASAVAPLSHSVFLEELTWLEVRDAIATGHSTVIVPIGGTEQNGPYLALGKHNFVVKGIAETTARVLGNALVAPIVAIGPGGSIDPATGHMRWPGSMAVRREVFQELLVDILSNLRHHGFRDIVVIAEHEGSSSQERPGPAFETVTELDKRWGPGETRAHFVPEYRDQLEDDGHASTFLRDVLGVVEEVMDQEVPESGDRYLQDGRNPVGTHEGYYYSAVTMAVNPAAVRAAERIAAGPQASYGVDWGSPEQLATNGRKLIDYRAKLIADAIRNAIVSSREP
ncbi:MAG: creatininase family protein [Gemmatimonas sp.]|nr:creatininase family protein [Gemmatimonas sp.]